MAFFRTESLPDRDVTPAEASALAAGGALLLDVREDHEWSAGHVEGAMHVPLGRLEPESLPDDRMILTLCATGNRSGKAASSIASTGRDVRNVAGGMSAWDTVGLPIVADTGTAGTLE